MPGSDGAFIRRSAKTRSWEKTEDLKRKLEEEYEAKEKGLEEVSRPEPALVTVKEEVARFLASKRNEKWSWPFISLVPLMTKLTTL